MWVGRGGVGDGVQVEEARGWDVGFLEDGVAGAVLGVVGEEPGCAQRDDARGCCEFCGGVVFEGGVQVGGFYEEGAQGVGAFGGHGCWC